MAEILTLQEAKKTAHQLHSNNKTIVIAGGCFDLIHIGHIIFLSSAKKEGDFLFVLVESDKSVKNKKGESRPINSQKDRAEILSHIDFIDYVIPLPEMTKNEEYDTLMAEISPEVIAVTENDPGIKHNERQAKKYGGTVKSVTNRIEAVSSSKLAGLLGI